MSVSGSDDGLKANNTLGKKVEPLVTVQKLKDIYLFGLDIKNPNTGEDLPNETYQQYINNAVSMLEHYLDISISRVNNQIEYKDYRLNDYQDWGYYMCNNYPVIQVNSIKLVYFRDENGDPEVVQTIPNTWIRLQPHDGMIRLIPNARFPANLQISQTGSYFPEILRSQFVPHLWQIDYDFGFESSCVPVLLNQAVATIAAVQALIVGGNLVLGAGIAGSSISIDGLSQSIQTTQSAENSAFSATIKDYSDKLFGKTKDDPYSMLRILKDFYKGAQWNIL